MEDSLNVPASMAHQITGKGSSVRLYASCPYARDDPPGPPGNRADYGSRVCAGARQCQSPRSERAEGVGGLYDSSAAVVVEEEAALHPFVDNAGGHHRRHRGLPRVGDSARRNPPRGVPLDLVSRLLRECAVAPRQSERVRQVHVHKQPPLGAALRPRRPVDRRADPRGGAGMLVRGLLRRGPRGLRDEAGPHVDVPRGDKPGAERRHRFRPEARCAEE